MEPLGTPEITVETVWRTILITDARDSSKAYFSERSDEALVRIERDRALFARIAADQGGEEARDRGDGSMFAFDDPAAAVRAAMKMQSEMARINAALPEGALRLVHRMGIQVGSVKLATTGGHVPKRKLSGDIVVTAARLEAICHPGEVCFTNDVYQAIRGTIAHEFRFLDATMKGFDRPVRVWSTRLDRDWSRPLTAEEEQSKARRREEKRLREKWEREQREKRRRRIAVNVSAWAALLSLACATASFVRIQTNFHPLAKLHAALWPETTSVVTLHDVALPERTTVNAPHRFRVSSSVASPRRGRFRVASRHATRAVVRRPAPSRVSALVRQALNEGRFDDLPGRLSDLGLVGDEFEKLCDDARRVELTRDWLQEQVEPTLVEVTPGIRLETPVAGIVRLTWVGDGAVHGVDESERPVSKTFLELSPDALGSLVRSVGEGAGAPDSPETIERSLADLRHRAGR